VAFTLRATQSIKEPINMSQRTKFPTVPVEEVPAPGSGEDTSANRPVVLVVDDESVIADTLAEILTRSGYAAMPAYDAEEALETALLVPPELLVADVVLPGMSGIELAIKVRRIFPDCKILLFSGQAATVGLLASANSEGHSFELLSKPIHPKDLLRQVSASFKSRGEKSAEGVA
jgi:DNA-binding response OmpR family regulator